MKELHTNKQAQQDIINAVTDWYKWCIENLGNDTSTKILGSKIGHISNSKCSIQITIENDGGTFEMYFYVAKWFIKKALQGNCYRFSKKALTHKECVEAELV